MVKNNKKVLIIEDDKFLRKIYEMKLTKAGFNISVAKNGEEGLKAIMKEQPDLVLLDMVMPKMSGFDVLEAVKNNPEINKTKIIVLSNLGQESDIKKGQQLGAIGYIVKTKIDVQEIVEIVRKHLS